MVVARLRHPARSREMAVVDDAGAFRFEVRIQAEYDLDGLPPVGAFLGRVQQPEVGREMALVVRRQLRALWGPIFEGDNCHVPALRTVAINTRVRAVTVTCDMRARDRRSEALSHPTHRDKLITDKDVSVSHENYDAYLRKD